MAPTGRVGRAARCRARRRLRTLAAVVASFAALVLVPPVAFAHPLGNFTINHYAGVRVAVDAISLDVVIDEAEIPTFTERQRIDTDGDGQVSDAETEAERQITCSRLAPNLRLTVDGIPAPLTAVAAGLSFPAGAGGLQTMRIVCEFAAPLGHPLAAGTAIHLADTSSPGRIGWREIVVGGDGATIAGDGLAGPSVSGRLTHYPQDLLSVPLAMGDAVFSASPGGPASAAPCIADAFRLTLAPTAHSAGFGCGSAPAASAAPAVATVPGGVGAEISGLLKTEDLTPPILILSLVTAMALGAAHALTPGHGKTIMAAYLVGTRGTARHALALGLTVTLSHTIGVLALALVILALRLVTPESYNHVTGILSGIVVIGIGVWLFFRQLPLLRARLAQRAETRAHAREDPHGHEHPDEHVHRHVYEHVYEHGPGALDPARMHSHGGVRHSHIPVTDTPLTWRTLFALGLFGGLVPSINALIILLATLATGRAAYGLVLVVAFGAGMAIVLGGIGLGLVYASRFMERGPRSSLFGGIVGWAPAFTAVIILIVGIYVTSQAILGAPVL
ncbi:MAG: hypothetical protein M3067_07310 [Chloroflexota bacterium]|nr:hypothetical protein [Chloroflexota bacterium]